MTVSRTAALLLATLLVGSALTVGATTVAASSPDVQVASVDVAPADPVAGESVTFETTVANLQRTNGTVQVSDVYLRRSGSTREYARVEDVGSVAPGGSITDPLTAEFDNAGDKELTVTVVVQDQRGRFHRYSYPARVDVERPVVRGGLSANGSTSDETNVTLTNYGNVNFTDVEVSAEINTPAAFETYGFAVTYTVSCNCRSTKLCCMNPQLWLPAEVRSCRSPGKSRAANMP
jgi:hypothetical protein